jgi:hypothetical protein
MLLQHSYRIDGLEKNLFINGENNAGKVAIKPQINVGYTTNATKKLGDCRKDDINRRLLRTFRLERLADGLSPGGVMQRSRP